MDKTYGNVTQVGTQLCWKIHPPRRLAPRILGRARESQPLLGRVSSNGRSRSFSPSGYPLSLHGSDNQNKNPSKIMAINQEVNLDHKIP